MQKTIALLTDFGVCDGYVAAMKGVINSIDPSVNIIDIAHDIIPQDIQSAAFVLWNVYKYFPKKTVFVSVVDPGVGTERKIICVQTADYCFLAPDNGLLKFIFGSEKIKKIINIENKKYFLPVISNTFHGRDIFAPVAAYIAGGCIISEFGREIIPSTKSEKFLMVTPKGKQVDGKVIHIDRFGNIISNFLVSDYSVVKYIKKLLINKHSVNVFRKTYFEVSKKLPFYLIGSRNLLEISIPNGNAAKVLSAQVGTRIKLFRNENE